MRHLIPQLQLTRVSWTLLVIASVFCFLLLFMCSAVVDATGQKNTNAAAAQPPQPAKTPKKDNQGAATAGSGAVTPKKTAKRRPETPKDRSEHVTTPSDNQGSTSEQSTLTDIYVSWLDDVKETAIVAFTNPSTRRVVVGIAKPSQTKEGPGHLNDIPGFKEGVTNNELVVFRAALTGTTQEEYRVIDVPSQGTPVSFDQIDKKFRDYVHSATTNLADLDVWDVGGTGTAETRIVFLGDIVLVKPMQVSSQNKAEDAMFQLLIKMALAEKKGIRKISLQGGCIGAASTFQAVRKGPFNEESRKELRNVVTGRMAGRNGEALNEFIVTNSGWVNRNLHLDVQPVPTSESAFKVTAAIGETEKPILNQPDLELQPCEVARISIEPLHWYYDFPTFVSFRYDESGTTLSATVPETNFNWFSIFAGVAVLAGVGLVIWLVLQFIPRQRQPKKDWGAIIGPKVGLPVTEKKILVSEPRSGILARLLFWKKKTVPEHLSRDTLEPLTSEHLNQQIAQFNSQYEQFIVEIRAALPYLENANETQKKLVEAERQLNHWQETLKELGDSPDSIVTRWKAFKLNHEDVENNVKVLWGLTGKHQDGKERDALQTLTLLQQEVPKLKGYEAAALQIAGLINEKSSETPTQREAKDVVETVKKLRNFTVRVLRKYAKRLQVENESDQFSEQSLTELENLFSSAEKAIETLDGMEEDERIRLARLVSVRIQKAGTQLDRLARTNPESQSMFDAIDMELTVIAPQLHEASASLNATLGRVSSRQVRSDNGKPAGQLNTNDVLVAFMSKLLSDRLDPMVNMLRLWQVMEIYCHDSTDPVAAKLYVESAGFRNTCVQILADFKCLGIHFHQIEFLKKPEAGLVFDEAHTTPRLQNNDRLYGPIQRRFLSSGLYWGTIADVAKWGFECELEPALNSRTMLWRWRKVST